MSDVRLLLRYCLRYLKAVVSESMAVSKCYIIMMEEENFELLLMSSQSSEQQLARLISYIFSNEHLYVDASFRHLIELDRKGFVNAY